MPRVTQNQAPSTGGQAPSKGIERGTEEQNVGKSAASKHKNKNKIRRLRVADVVCHAHLHKLMRRAGDKAVEEAISSSVMSTSNKKSGSRAYTLKRAAEAAVAPPFSVRISRRAAEMLAEMVASTIIKDVGDLMTLTSSNKPSTVNKRSGRVVKRRSQLQLRHYDALLQMRDEKAV